MAMTAFVQQNEASLTDYFNEGLVTRNKFVLVSGGLGWSANNDEHSRLGARHAPVLCSPLQTLKGMHAHAFIFEDFVVKTNLFGQYHQEGQRQWLEWCKEHQGNPLVPKLAFLITDEQSDRYLVVMERLKCHSGFNHHEFRKDIDQSFVASFQRQPLTAYPALSSVLTDIKKNSLLAVVELKADLELMREIDDQVVERELQINLIEHQIALDYIEEIETFWLSLRTVNSNNYEQVRIFWDTLTNKGHEIDVHGLNWMLRHNGEQVLLDPVN